MLGLWLFAAVALLSIAAQNIFFFGLGAWALALWTGGRQQRAPHPALVWVLPFLLWALLASWSGEHRGHSLETWRKWLLVVAAFQASALLTKEQRLSAVVGSFLFFSGLVAFGASLWALRGPALALWQGQVLSAVVQRWADEGAWRAVSGSGGYMVLGTGSMMALCFGAGLVSQDARWRRPLVYACLVSLALALFLTQTRSAWFGAAAGLLFLSFKTRPWMAVTGLALAALLLAIPGNPVRARLAQGLDMSRDSTRERVYMALSGAAIVRDAPWTGVGDSLEDHGVQPGVYPRYESAQAKQWDSIRGKQYGHLHNNALQLAVMYGLPGLGLMLAAMAALAWALGRGLDRSLPLARGVRLGALAVLLAWWVNGMLEYNFGSVQSSFTFWFLLGCGLGAARLEEA